VSADVDQDIEIEDVAIPPTISRSDDDLAFMLKAAIAIDAASEFPTLNVCVTEPEIPKARRRWPADEQQLAEMLRNVVAKYPRVVTTTGDTWRVQIKRSECLEAAPPGNTETASEPISSGSP
jgi:hypothetical protein